MTEEDIKVDMLCFKGTVSRLRIKYVCELVKMCNAAEHRTVDTLIDSGPQRAGLLDVKVVQGRVDL